MNKYAYSALIGLAAVFGIAMPGVSAAHDDANPQTCEGYPEKRVFLESQVWWKDSTTNESEGRHLHMGTCFPLHQNVQGVVHLDVRIMAHNMENEGTIKALRVQIFGNGSSGQFTTKLPLSLDCQSDDCMWWQDIDVDTRKVPYDGRWEFRITANISDTAQGHRMYQTTRWHATLANGKPVQDKPNPARSPGAGGWYTGTGYMNVFCGIGGTGYDLVTKVQSGVAKITCKFEGKNATASIDPAFHDEPPNEGTVLLNTNSGGTHSITINTASLGNGAHKLFLKTDATGVNGGTGSGVLILPFTVQN